MSSALARQLLELSVAERIQLAEDLWDSVAAEPEKVPGLTDHQIAAIHQRVADHEQDPSTAIEWQEVRSRLWSRLR